MTDIFIKVQVKNKDNWVSLYRGDNDSHGVAAQVFENAEEGGFEVRGLHHDGLRGDGSQKWRLIELSEIKEEAEYDGINPLEGLLIDGL